MTTGVFGQGVVWVGVGLGSFFGWSVEVECCGCCLLFSLGFRSGDPMADDGSLRSYAFRWSRSVFVGRFRWTDWNVYGEMRNSFCLMDSIV